MFSGLVSQVHSDLADVKAVVEWQEKLRTTLSAAVGSAVSLNLDAASIQELRSQAPTKLTWQVFDHCAAVSRIYALYERSVEDLVTSYLAYMPRVSPAYLNLAESLRTQHRVGVGQILLKWNAAH